MLRAISNTALLICFALPFRIEAQSPAVPSDPPGVELRVTPFDIKVDGFVVRGFVRRDSLVLLSDDSVHQPIPMSRAQLYEIHRRNQFVVRGFVRGDSLVILSGDSAPRTMPLSAVHRLERSRRNHIAGAVGGFLAGTLVGVVVGGGLGYVADVTRISKGYPPATFVAGAGGALLGAVAGTLVFGIRGVRSWHVAWPTEPASSSTPKSGATIHLGPQLDGRLAARLSIPWP